MFRKPTKATDGAGWICSTETKHYVRRTSQILDAEDFTAHDAYLNRDPADSGSYRAF
jgi:hypothetical protein